MTEPVLKRRSPCAVLASLALALALPVTSLAAPATGDAPEGPASNEGSAAQTPDEAKIRAALDAGDLTSARELAQARAKADPSADNHALLAEVWIALGDYERAKASLSEAIAALPEGDERRDELAGLRDELEEASRGARADEPASEHRERLDAERAERLAALAPAPAPVDEPVDEPTPREPIVKKWYFWVTLGAIVATAGAIVGVAVASSVDERDGAAASRLGPTPSPAGGLTIRF